MNTLPMYEVMKLICEYDDERMARTREVERRQMPAVDPSKITGNTPDEKYVQTAIQQEVEHGATRAPGSGERYSWVRDAALKLESLRLSEGLSPEARSLLNVEAIVFDGAARNGALQHYGETHLRKAIDWAVARAEPRPIPADWGANHQAPPPPSINGTNGHHPEIPTGGILYSLTESNIRGEIPPFPDLAWHPTLLRITDWLARSTEAPWEYLYSGAKTLAELAIGRDVFAQMWRRLYVNSAQANIGPVAEKKGTAWAIIADEIISAYGGLIGLDDSTFRMIRATGSAEGLLQTFMDEVEETDEKGKKSTQLEPVPGRRVVTIEEELGYLLVKAHKEGTTNFQEIVCQLWDGVDVSPQPAGAA